ncbi:glycosyltransferase [Pseudomonadales bacterium]|nr:glycosyltransferase [Pseudomonadales bacterium]
MKATILHISHTDISGDSRILKEMQALTVFAADRGLKVVGIGIAEEQGNKNNKKLDNCEIYSVNLLMRKLPVFVRRVLVPLILIELVIRFLWLIRNYKPVVIHCHDTIVLPIALVLSLKHDVRLVYDAHELESRRNRQNRLNSALTKFIEYVAWKRIDLFISVSPSINEWYLEEFGHKKNVTVLNSPEVPKYIEKAPGNVSFRQKFRISRSEIVFVYLGVFSPGRGIKRVLDVFSNENVSSHLLFVGWGDYEELIEGYSRKNANIHIHEPVAHKDVVSLISECNFGLCMVESVSLSDYFCLPNKLFEYCFSGLPVLASDLPELSRVIKDHDIGVTCGVSDEEMIAAVITLSSGDLSFRFRNLENLSWQTQSNILLDGYSELLQ